MLKERGSLRDCDGGREFLTFWEMGPDHCAFTVLGLTFSSCSGFSLTVKSVYFLLSAYLSEVPYPPK